MPRPFTAVLLLLALTAAPSALAAQNGNYSNLCRSPQSGDLDGMTLTLSGTSTAPSVALQVCEGPCWNARIAEVRLEGDRLTFTAEEREVNDHNAVAKDMVYRFTAQLTDDRATLSANMVYGAQILRRLGAPKDGAAPLCR